MSITLRVALLFALGLAAGLAWVKWQPDSLPFGRGADAVVSERSAAGDGVVPTGIPHALDRPLPGPDWGRITVRASTGRLAPAPAGTPGGPEQGSSTPPAGPAPAYAPDADPPGSDQVEPLWSAGDELDPTLESDPVWTPPPPADVEVTVPDGGSLSQLAYDHYGRVDDEMLAALARYNGLDDPDRVRAGQTLRLPAIERLNER